MITTANFADLVANSKIKWKDGFKLVPFAMRTIFDAYDTDDYTSSHSSLDGFGMAKRKSETGSFKKGDPNQGYKINLQQARIGLVGEVTWEMRRFDQYRKIGMMMKKLGESTAKRLELDLANYLTYGLQGTSYTNIDGETVNTVTGDTKAVFATDHTVSGGAGTYSNKGTKAFDADGVALGLAMQLFTQMLAPSGDRVHRSPNKIITSDHHETVINVGKLLNSTSIPGQNNSAVANPYKGKFEHIIAPKLAEDKDGIYNAAFAKQWYLQDAGAKELLPCEVSEKPNFKAPSADASLKNSGTTDVWEFVSSAAYDYGVVEGSSIVGMDGTT